MAFSDQAPKNFLTSFGHYVRIDISCTSTNSNAPYAVVECLKEACAHLCSQLTLPNKDSKRPLVSSASLWPSLLAFSDLEAQNSAAAKQLRGTFLIGLGSSNGSEAMGFDEDDEPAQTQMNDMLVDWVARVQGHRAFVDEPKAPHISAKLVTRDQLGQIVLDKHMWPLQHQQDVHRTTASNPDASEPDHSPSFYFPQHHTPTQDKTGMPSRSSPSRKLRSSEDVLKRLRWDDDLDAEDYSVVYLDRFAGYLEMPVSRWKGDTSDDEFIPLHRITGFRRVSTGEVVWSREARIDKIFNSS